MWFKNMLVYRLTKAIDFSQDVLEKSLSTFAYKACGSQDLSSVGWVPPLGKYGKTLTHFANGEILITMKIEEKMLPSSVVKEELDARIEAASEREGRDLKRAEKQALKDDVIVELLPRSFSKYTIVKAWISPANSMIVVDAASARRSDILLGLLRKSLGTLPVLPIVLETPAEVTMTEWLKDYTTVPKGFEVGESVELKSQLESGCVVRCKNQNLISDEIAAHLESDKMVTKLGLSFGEYLDFSLKDDFSIKSVKFSNELLEQNDDAEVDDVAAKMDADFVLMTGTLNEFFPALIEALGGEQESL